MKPKRKETKDCLQLELRREISHFRLQPAVAKSPIKSAFSKTISTLHSKR